MNTLRWVATSLVVYAALSLLPVGTALAQQVKVSSATPSSTYQGTVSLDVVIAGSGFDQTSQAQFFVTGTTNPGGVTVKKTTFHNSKEIVATIDVADTADVASFDVQVTLDSGRKGKGTTLFAVQKKTTNTDPCSTASPDYSTNWMGFPAYAYVLGHPGVNGQPDYYEIRVASRNGVCSKRVGEVQSGFANSLSFARTSDPALPYVVAWEAGGIRLARFSLDGASATTIPAAIALFRPDVFAPDLSPDGNSLAYAMPTVPYMWDLRIASLGEPDTTGAHDTTAYSFENRDAAYVAWAPWGKVYIKTLDLTNGRQILAIDPTLPAGSQAPESLLRLPASAPLQVNVLFDFAKMSAGYAGYDSVGVIPQVVFQGLYTTGVKRNGASGSWCAAAYSLHAQTHAFLIGSTTVPSSIAAFYPSVTADGTTLYDKSSAPTSGASCNATGYIGESPLASGYPTYVGSDVAGSWPAALKNP